MHRHKLHYDVQTRQVKIAGINSDQIVAIKEHVLPALTSTVLNVKYKTQHISPAYTPPPPRTPMISGMPAVISIDKNNNCKIIVDNCAPYDVTIDRNHVIGLMDIKSEILIPIEDSVISSIISDIHKK
jgi:hypothetical protein